MIKVVNITPGSIADELGIHPGDEVVSVNGKDITDALDYRFYITTEEVELAVRKDDEEIIYEIAKDYDDDLGISLEELELRFCGNSCIFCFVYQNPKGLRKSLYIKDEDYRFSFLYGHYTTLTNATEADLERIVEQRLSPLYISVHVTDPQLRKLMLGIKFDDHLLEKIDFLTRNRIELNCQIVLCPELNDGEKLDRTIEDLKAFYPGIRSIAVVPVGLTRHRRNLYPIKPVTPEYSLKTIAETDKRRRRLKKELGSSFVYLSDEFYITTDTEIPGNDYYENFYQLENGVGLTRDLLNILERELPALKNPFPRPLNLSFVTGMLGARVLKKYFLDKLNAVPGLNIKLHPVLNRFYGPSIIVSGLLVGEDIYEALQDGKTGDYIILPPDCVNADGVFLDDTPLAELQQRLGKPLISFPRSFSKMLSQIAEHEAALSSYSR